MRITEFTFSDPCPSQPTLRQLEVYGGYLKRWFRTYCDTTYRTFQGAIYPMDPTPDTLRRLVKERLPEDLSQLLDTGAGKSEGGPPSQEIATRFTLWVLTRNPWRLPEDHTLLSGGERSIPLIDADSQ